MRRALTALAIALALAGSALVAVEQSLARAWLHAGHR
jgi:hypothetical protein